MSDRRHVFFDPSGRRGKAMLVVGTIVAVLAVLGAVAFGTSLTTTHLPHDAAASLFGVSEQRHAEPKIWSEAKELAVSARALERSRTRAAATATLHRGTETPGPLQKPDGRPLSVAFYVNWDDNSRVALERRIANIDVLMPVWLTLKPGSMDLIADIDQPALDIIAQNKPNMPILPVVQNSVDDNWDGAGLAQLVGDPARRTGKVQELLTFVLGHKFNGLTLDLENIPPEAQQNLQTFVSELHDSLHAHGLSLAIAAPFADDSWDYKRYGEITDFVILMAYDEHWAQGTPGSIASQSWFEDALDKRMAELDPDHTMVAIGGYGYDWVKGRTAADLTFHEAIQAAADSEADIDFDDASNNPHFSYKEDDGTTHTVWFLDATTGYNEIHAADIYRPAGYALWRLGSEDPSLWDVMGQPYGNAAPETLKTIEASPDITITGAGEILRVSAKPEPGSRTIRVEKDSGDIVDEDYDALPSSYVIKRLGDAPKKIALTFDDGPDPTWTPQILDALEQAKTPATFFVIGENGAAYPSILRRIVDDGFEIGNHSYTHPNFALIPTEVARLELNATQRLVEATTGRSMRLFRPPFLGDSEPSTTVEVRPVDVAQSMGYLAVGLKIDPDDWQRPTAAQIVDRVITAATSGDPETRGNIVLLHDAGGDRSSTLAALPQIIEQLRARGFEFVTVSDLAGLTRDQAMPPVPNGSRAATIDAYVFGSMSFAGAALGILFGSAIVLGVARALLLAGLALINRQQDRRRVVPPMRTTRVSVLIPAFNEAKVIVASVARVLDSTFAELQVVVVDDGSTDGTGELVRQAFGTNPHVTVLSLPNGGKAKALNAGLQLCSGEVVVALDADTQFEPHTISRLSRWFADPMVGAVAGNAKVGNRINMVTRWQALEYITAQNLERRALAVMGAITVVPGAVGAWRRQTITDLGGFPDDTLAEDQDLTLAVQRAGLTVIFDDSAVAWTEAPDTLRALAKQRFRWAFGTLQCLWKHKSALLNPRAGTLGLLALPQVVIFQIALALLSPLVDLLLVWQLVRAGVDFWQHGDQFVPDSLIFTLICFAIFVLVDTVCASVAFAIERKEDWRLLLWLPLQRFGYRQVMYYVVVKSVLKAMTGPRVGWGKLARTGSVAIGGSTPNEPPATAAS